MKPPSVRRRVTSSGIVVVALGARVVALLVLCLLAWAAVPKLIAWTPTTVVSGSMEPRILTGDLVVSMPIDGSDVAAGQVVLVDDPGTTGALLLHRVVEREAEGLRLQGDANPQPDRQLVQDDAVRGVGVLRVPYIGLPIVWAKEGAWGALAIVAALALVVVGAIVSTRRYLVDDYEETAPVGRVRRAVPIAGAAVAGLLAVVSVLPTAGASWQGATGSVGNHLATGAFSCLGQPLGSPEFRLDFSEADGAEVLNSGTGSNVAQLSGTAERIDGSCGDSPFVRLDGQAGQVATMQQLQQQTTFTLETWFRTTKPQGKLIGFGNAQTAPSSAHDRHLYIDRDGRLVFGTWSGAAQTIATAGAVTDGRWHHVMATMSTTDGMRLYVDGALVGTNSNTVLQNYAGYWRIGHDTIASTWPAAPASGWFAGDLDGIAIHARVLSAEEAAEHAGAGRP